MSEELPLADVETAWRGRYQPPALDTRSETGQEARLLALELRGEAEEALKAIEEVKEDNRYTDMHRSQRARKIAVEAAAKVREKVGGLEELEERLAKERAQLREKTVQARDPSDSAGQLMDSEIRAVLRGMKPADRAKYLLRQAPADVVEAALRGAPVLTGLDPQIHDDLTERAINTRFAAEVEDLENAERNIQAARRARDNAYQLLVEAGGRSGPGAAEAEEEAA